MVLQGRRPGAARDSGKAKLLTLPFLALLVGVAVVAVALMMGQRPSHVAIPGGVEVDFDNGAAGQKLSTTDVSKAQPQIEKRIADLEREARASAGASASAAAPTDTVIAGMWSANNGLTYRFDQFGTSVTFQEISAYGVSAAGSGAVSGAEVRLTFVAFNGSSGRVELRVSGTTMTGTIMNDSFGTQAPLELHR